MMNFLYSHSQKLTFKCVLYGSNIIHYFPYERTKVTNVCCTFKAIIYHRNESLNLENNFMIGI